MSFQHNYITTPNHKPTVGTLYQNELVINQGDGTLWTKTSGGQVKKIVDNTFTTTWAALPPSTGITNSGANEYTKFGLINDNVLVLTGISRFTRVWTSSDTFVSTQLGTLPAPLRTRIKHYQFGLAMTPRVKCHVIFEPNSGRVFLHHMGESGSFFWAIVHAVVPLDV